MRLIFILISVLFVSSNIMADNLHKFSINDIDGNIINLNQFKGKPVLLVNTASRCGFTKQYANLSNLHQKYFEKDLIIIGTPSNSFYQELNEEKDVKEFCLINYDTKFIVSEIIDVNGDTAHPLYKWMTETYGKIPKWNFFKYLFDGEGNLVESWSSITKPDSSSITNQIDKII